MKKSTVKKTVKSAKKSSASKVNSNLMKFFYAALALALIALVYKAATPSLKVSQPIGINEVSSLGYATLAISPVTANTTGIYPLTGKTPMKITLNPGTSAAGANKVVAATVELSYDPNKVVISDVARGDFFSNTFAAPVIDTTNKKVTFSFAVAPADGGKSTEGVVATFNMQPIVSGDIDIAFAAPTNVRAEGFTDNILKVADTFNFKGKAIMTLAEHDKKTDVVTVILDNDSEKTDWVGLYKIPSTSRITSTETSRINWVYENNTQVARTTDAQPSPILTMSTTPAQVSAAGSFAVAYWRKVNGAWKIIDQTFVTSVTKIDSDIVEDGDATGDHVNAQDYTQFVLDFGKTNTRKGWIRSDINSDGVVNIADYPTFVREWSL